MEQGISGEGTGRARRGDLPRGGGPGGGGGSRTGAPADVERRLSGAAAGILEFPENTVNTDKFPKIAMDRAKAAFNIIINNLQG